MRKGAFSFFGRWILFLGAGIFLVTLLSDVIIPRPEHLGRWPLSWHMGVHILLMNAVAPIAALSLVEVFRRYPKSFLVHSLLAATLAQVAMLWIAHVPSVVEWAMYLPAAHLVMQIALFASALWFWLAAFLQSGASRWRAIVAMLITGKLFCLLGILFVFAPRPLYAGLMHDHGGDIGLAHSALADQQLAGLLMVVACPLTYVLAGVVIAARWLTEIGFDEPAATTLRRGPSSAR